MIIFENDSLGRSIIEIVFLNRGSIFAKEGVAFLLAHIFNTKGTLNKKERFFSQIEEKAIEFSANVNKEFFTLSLKFLDDKEKKALKYFKEIMLNPNITKESVEKGRVTTTQMDEVQKALKSVSKILRTILDSKVCYLIKKLLRRQEMRI